MKIEIFEEKGKGRTVLKKFLTFECLEATDAQGNTISVYSEGKTFKRKDCRGDGTNLVAESKSYRENKELKN